MKRKPVPSNESILPKDKAWLIGVRGMVGAVIALAIFVWYGGNVGTDPSTLAQTMVFNFVVLSELFLIFIIRSHYRIKQFSNMWLWLGIGISLALQAVIMYTPLKTYFKIDSLGLYDIGVVFVASFGFYLLFTVFQVLSRVKLKIRSN